MLEAVEAIELFEFDLKPAITGATPEAGPFDKESSNGEVVFDAGLMIGNCRS